MANCGASQSTVFKPAMRIIQNITQTDIAEVTTTFAHGYLSGLTVRLYVPLAYGMVQADHLIGDITVTSDVTFTIPIDTTNFDPFVIPPGTTIGQDQYCPIVVPIGEQTSQINQSFNNVL